MDIVVGLRSLDLEEYEEAFRDNKINERVLPNLTQEDLKEGVGGYSSKLSLLYVPMRPARRPRLKCAPLHCT
jgi:SAM (Sterile alpha motif) domain-containing protein